MSRKELPLPAIIAAIVVVVALLCVFGYRQLASPGYATTKETGVPEWVKNWKPDQKVAPGSMTSSGVMQSGGTQGNGQSTHSGQ